MSSPKSNREIAEALMHQWFEEDYQFLEELTADLEKALESRVDDCASACVKLAVANYLPHTSGRYTAVSCVRAVRAINRIKK